MKVLVSPGESACVSTGCFCYVPEGELLTFSDQYFCGIKSRKATTLAKVVDLSISIAEVKLAFSDSEASAFGSDEKGARRYGERLANIAIKTAASLQEGMLIRKVGKLIEQVKETEKRAPALNLDQAFRIKLLKAERIRIEEQFLPGHRTVLSNIIEYAEENKLLDKEGEFWAIGAEIAAGYLEFAYGENIGSVINLSLDQKKVLCEYALSLATSDMPDELKKFLSRN